MTTRSSRIDRYIPQSLLNRSIRDRKRQRPFISLCKKTKIARSLRLFVESVVSSIESSNRVDNRDGNDRTAVANNVAPRIVHGQLPAADARRPVVVG